MSYVIHDVKYIVSLYKYLLTFSTSVLLILFLFFNLICLVLSCFIYHTVNRLLLVLVVSTSKTKTFCLFNKTNKTFSSLMPFPYVDMLAFNLRNVSCLTLSVESLVRRSLIINPVLLKMRSHGTDDAMMLPYLCSNSVKFG